MQIFVINLDQSTERLRHMQHALGELNLPFERIAAVDGQFIPEVERRAFAAARRPYFPWTPRVIGCVLSHAEAWRRASGRPDQWTVILEDDVRLSPSLPGFLSLLDSLPFEINACRFESCRHRPVWLGAEVARLGNAGVYRLGSKVGGSAGYAIRGRGAAALLGSLTKISRPVDEIFTPKRARKLGLVVAQTMPALAEQTLDDTSTIFPERRARRRAQPKLSRPVKIHRALRRAFRHSVGPACLTLRGYRLVSLRLP